MITTTFGRFCADEAVGAPTAPAETTPTARRTNAIERRGLRTATQSTVPRYLPSIDKHRVCSQQRPFRAQREGGAIGRGRVRRDLSSVDEEQDARDATHIRPTQRHIGLPVWTGRPRAN